MRRVYLGAVVGALVSLAFVSPALAADRVEPLNQYIVTRHGCRARALGKLGYDVTEGAIAPGRTGIVATPSQADALRAAGLRRHAARQGEHAIAAAPAAGSRSPTRPGATTSSGRTRSSRRRARRRARARSTPPAQPVKLRKYYDTLAAANPTLVKREVYGQSLLGTDLVAYKVTDERQHDRRRRQARRDVPRRPARARVDLGRGRAARLPVLPRPRRRRRLGHPGGPRLDGDVVHPGPEPGRLRLHVPDARHAPVAQEPARQQRQRHDPPAATASTPTATSPRSGATTTRARQTRRRRHLPRPVAGVRARGVELPRADGADQARVLRRLPLLREPRPVSRRLAGRDLRRRHAADGGARGHRPQPGGRGL